MASRKFIFPRGVRFPTEDEIPNNDLKPGLLERIKSADIQEGYVLVDSGDPNYQYYAEINVTSDEVWTVFASLCRSLLPEVAAPIIGEKDKEKEEMFLGPYTSREALLSTLVDFKYELANDGFIQFGLIHQVKGKTEEVFVEPSKHFVVWTSDDVSLRSVMLSCGIPERDKLSFIDEYPRVTLAEYEGASKRFSDVIEELTLQCTKLTEV